MDKPGKKRFQVNDFVFAKLTTYPAWPAVVIEPDPLAPPRHKSNAHWVYFFGSHDYAWVEEEYMEFFDEYKEIYKHEYKQPSIHEAIEELEEIIENIHNDPEYKIEFIKYKRKNRKRSRKDSASPTQRSSPPKERNVKTPSKKSRSQSRSKSRSKSRSRSRSSAPGNLQENNNKSTPTISPKTFGFLAANIYAEPVIKNLIKSGHRLRVWCSTEAMRKYLRIYAKRWRADFKICNSKREVAYESDIIFSCLTDPEQARKVLEELGLSDDEDDLLDGIGYVEMTCIDPDVSVDMCKKVENKGGTYIEAMLQGNSQEAIKGRLVVIAAGIKPAFKECESCFAAIGQTAVRLDFIGSAIKTHIILQVMKGVIVAGLAEGFAVADKSGLLLDVFTDLLGLTNLSCEFVQSKAEMFIEEQYSVTEDAVEHLQKNLAQLNTLSNQLRQPIPMAALTNQIFKHARRLGFDTLDSACVYNRTRY